jgi:hypothetical protein
MSNLEQMQRMAELKSKYGITFDGQSDAIHLVEKIETVVRDQILDMISDELFENNMVEETDDKYSLLLTAIYHELIYKLNTKD